MKDKEKLINYLDEEIINITEMIKKATIENEKRKLNIKKKELLLQKLECHSK